MSGWRSSQVGTAVRVLAFGFILSRPSVIEAATYSAPGFGIEWSRAQSLALYGDGIVALTQTGSTFTALRGGLDVGLGGAGLSLGIGRIGTEVHAPTPVFSGFLNGLLIRPWWDSSLQRDFYGGAELSGHVLIVGAGVAALWNLKEGGSPQFSIALRLGFP